MTRVLLVDDKEENLYYLRALLEADGREVECAHNGAEALALALASPPAVIISDLLMPVMDGYTLLRNWKADPRLKSVPFIVYTATYVAPEDEDLALKLGADAFLLKPTEPDELLSRLKAVEANPTPAVPSAEELEPGVEPGRLREYSETLIRKLEQKTLELEQTNRALERDIAARVLSEAALKRAEEQLRQAQKMEAVGRLAGGVAHDFNNLLSVIVGHAALVLEEMKPEDKFVPDLEAIRRAGERAADLTRQLLVFSRQQLLEPRVLRLGQVVSELAAMLPRLLGEDIELSVSTAGCVGKVHADASQIEQIVMNLAVNARDAMPQGGKLGIETADVELDASDAERHPSLAPGSYAVLTVADSGVGMDAATRERIFEPFFTTKEKGKGTGLGLATVFGIVKQSRGHVEVHSEPGAGTTFKVYFPCTDRAIEPAPASAAVTVLRGSETILLVEDDEQVRALNAAVLRRSGYRVLDAKDGILALVASEKLADPIHLLLTDVIMPRMNGRELAERITSARPATKVLFLSGYASDSIVRNGVLDLGVAFLQKPATPKSLLQKVGEVLDAP
jgi:two-component system, cell cycle sensor histidine kinase and response regulator CckA